ncbi:MAG TPA: hypothetical protein VFD67_04910 [Gemmatimonadaceae bacterium]|nr:hypothetical protein [Gemmatimonadaceae bacterium]
MRVDLLVHITAGAVGILSGYVALAASKGETVHRKSGIIFVYAMLTMALMGATIALARNVAPAANAPMGVLTAYLVLTGLTTVRPPGERARSVDVGLLFVVLCVTATLLTFGFRVLASPSGRLYGMPAAPFLIFGCVALLACVGDLKLLRAGGVRTLRRAPRLARHLWRMCTAFLIAAFSFFLGQAKVIPKPIRIVPLLVIPPLVVLVTMLYWLWRVRVRPSRTASPVILSGAKDPLAFVRGH